jgi:hypothetical protein
MAFATRLVKTAMKELPNARTALRVAAVVAIGATAVQFVIWLLIVLISQNLQNPWWMWTLLAAGILVGAGRLLNGSRGVARRQAGTDVWDAR